MSGGVLDLRRLGDGDLRLRGDLDRLGDLDNLLATGDLRSGRTVLLDLDLDLEFVERLRGRIGDCDLRRLGDLDLLIGEGECLLRGDGDLLSDLELLLGDGDLLDDLGGLRGDLDLLLDDEYLRFPGIGDFDLGLDRGGELFEELFLRLCSDFLSGESERFLGAEIFSKNLSSSSLRILELGDKDLDLDL